MISAEQVKELRAKTGAGMMDCKQALVEAGGDFNKAVDILREKGIAAAAKKAGRATGQGLVEAYVHGNRIGVLVEVNCETDFVANTKEFRNLCHDLAMQIAAARPSYVRREEVPEEVVAHEREVLRNQALREGKPEKIVDKIVEGRLNKFFEEACLEEQPFIKDPNKKVSQVVKEAIALLGENIVIRRFARLQLGEE
ncbi:MAG: translation elongation factor Ts [Clostridia bacterium]|nr:translation elongation factor Ts [Clostridia bacterium]